MGKDYTGHILEQVLDEIKAVHELVANVPTKAQFTALQNDVSELKQDMKIVTAAMKATNNDLLALDHRVTRLETA